ncbi:MAG: hypothetical protein MUE46_02650 [Xanthomonadales bacterium]|jgi:hypothetical protein|nr:hypothetical protein [Xanthomonadales bacterium]
MSLAHQYRFIANRQHTPMAPWVPLPVVEPPSGTQGLAANGHAVLIVQIGAFDLIFASLAELDHFLDVLSRRPLPRPARLVAAAGRTGGPNGHWLSRLPTALKGPRRHRWLPQLARLRQQVARLDWRTEALRAART